MFPPRTLPLSDSVGNDDSDRLKHATNTLTHTPKPSPHCLTDPLVSSILGDQRHELDPRDASCGRSMARRKGAETSSPSLGTSQVISVGISRAEVGKIKLVASSALLCSRIAFWNTSIIRLLNLRTSLSLAVRIMYTNTLKVLSLVAIPFTFAMDMSNSTVPEACKAICNPVVELVNTCNPMTGMDMSRRAMVMTPAEEQKAELDCICSNKSFDVKTIMGLCASCMGQNDASGVKNKTEKSTAFLSNLLISNGKSTFSSLLSHQY